MTAIAVQDWLMETIKKYHPHFILSIAPSPSSGTKLDMVHVRNQLRGLQALPVARSLKQGGQHVGGCVV